MGLYDGYRLANSTQVKQYQGSTVPELAQVSTEMQKRYDAAAEGQDYVTRFIGSMQSLDQDREALMEMSKEYRDRLQGLAGRKDLENTLRETSMLARDVPTAYAPFAARMKDFQDYQEQVSKAVREGHINQSTAAGMINMSRFYDKGIQKDPMTGRYAGRFKGLDYVKDININEKVDKWMQGADPQKTGWKIDNVNGQWITTNGKQTEVLSPERIQQIIQMGAQGDQEYQSWVRQQQDLQTYNKPYEVNGINMEEQLGSIRDPKKKGATIPLTLKDALNQAAAAGIAPADALRMIDRQRIGNQFLKDAVNYGVQKYTKNNVSTEFGLQANQVSRWNKEDQDKQMLQLASTMTLGGADVANANQFYGVRNDLKTSHHDLMSSYRDFMQGTNDGKPKISDGKGNIYYRENGKLVNVTKDANQFREQIKYADQQVKEMDMVNEAAQKASGFTITAEMRKRADAARKRAEETVPMEATERGGFIFPEARRKQAGQAAYEAELRKNRGYDTYEQELKRRLTGTTVGADLFAFQDAKVIESLSTQVENLISGLGTEKGMVPVEDRKGNQLSSDDWDELKGNMKAVGVTFTGNPSSPVALVVRGFKKVKGKETEGEDMIVRLPHTNIMSIAKNNMNPQQAQYFEAASNLATALNNPLRSFEDPQSGIAVKANTMDPRGGWTVRKGNQEATLYSFKDILDFIKPQQ